MSDERVGTTQSRPNTGTILGADTPGTSNSDTSLAEMLRDLSQQMGSLVRQELDLARSELAANAKRLALGSTMLGAGLLTVFALATLVTCAIAGLAEALPVWLAALTDWPLTVVSVAPLLVEAWQLRHNLTVQDALYVVATRRIHGANLVSTDRKLPNAPGVDVPVITPGQLAR